MARKRFNRNIIASSDAYKKHSHDKYIREWHKENIQTITELTARIVIKKKYYVKCFGKTIQITEKEAMMLGPELVIVI